MALRSTPPVSLPRPAARSLALAAQGLLVPESSASLGELLERHGLVRTLGGVDAYLALRARRPETTAAEVDAALSRGEIRVLPAARGCIYLVPASLATLCLRVAETLTRGRDEKEHAKAGIRPGEVDALGELVLATLAETGPLATDALRRALPAGSVRSLGEAGKKIGVSSPLPAALRRLEFAGRLERTIESGRLDSERYLWRLPVGERDATLEPRSDPAALHLRLAALYFRAAGVGTVAGFADWCGCTKREALAVVPELKMIEVEVEGEREMCFVPAEYERWLGAPPDSQGGLSLLPFEDNAFALHGGPAFFTEPRHFELVVPSWGSAKPKPLGETAHLAYRAIVADGRLAGFWELDPERGEVETALLEELSAASRRQLGAAAAAVRDLLTRQLGNARSYSLDTENDLARRVAALRALGH